MPSSELECSGAGCLVYFSPNLFLGSLPLSCTMTIIGFLLSVQFTPNNVNIVNSKTICKLTSSSAMIRHDDWHSVDSEGFSKMTS